MKAMRFPTLLISTATILLSVCALKGIPASAQEGHGTISGRALDRAGAVLAGAQVKLQPGDITGATDGQGEFNLIGLSPGNYTLTISYVGFKTFTQPITVVAGQASRVDAKLEVSARSEEVTVVADRPHGEAEAINRQRVSDNILQVLPSDVITSLPNANIADAVGRLPSVTLERDEGEGKYVQIRGTEPRLNAVTIDGVLVPAPEDNVRQVKLDTIPADIVESVEINKTLSANQDAEAIGGSVNLVTKSAGDSPTLILEGIGGFTPILNTRAIGQISGTIGQRFGATKKFGALFSGSFDYNGRGIDDIEPAPNNTLVPSYGSMDLREYRYRRKRYGFGGSLDYKLGDGEGLYLHYFYSDFRDFGDKWVYTLNDGTGCTGDATTPSPCPPPQFSSSDRAPNYRIGTVAIGGKHIFTNSWLAWEIATAASLQTAAAGNPGLDFQYNGPVTTNGQSVGSPICVNISPAPNPYLPQFSPACTAPGTPFYSPTNWSLLDVNTTSGNTSQVNIQGAFSFAKNYHLGKHNSTFEFGFKERNAHKGQNAYSPTYDDPTSAAPLMSQYLSGFTNPNYYFNDYRFGPVTTFSAVTAALPGLVSQGILSYDSGATHLASDASNFEYTERISAAYAMNTVEFGRFRLQLGFRVEATQLNTLGYIVNNDMNGNYIPPTIPAPANNWYWNPLPSAQLRYHLTDDSDIRVSYGRGISRPNPYDTIPYVEKDESTHPNSYTFGNPKLGPEHANNYDVLYEHYLKPFGEIQAGFFFKQLSDPIYYTQNLPGTSGPYAGFITSTIINGTHAWLTGFEAAYIQHLGFLPGGLSGFGISANYSWTTSNSGPLPGRSDTPALQRQAPSTWNISPTYDRGKFSSRIGLSYNGSSIFQYQYQSGGSPDLGPNGPAGDVYFYPHLQLDAQASYRVRKDLTFIVQGLNLTNEVFGFCNGSPDYVIQREFYSPTYSFGLRWEPRRE